MSSSLFRLRFANIASFASSSMLASFSRFVFAYFARRFLPDPDEASSQQQVSEIG
ncbi:hypothetical protein ACHAWF_001167, partial [Thalassiosira exigua]